MVHESQAGMAYLMRDASRLPLIIADANLPGFAGKRARFQKLVRHFQNRTARWTSSISGMGGTPCPMALNQAGHLCSSSCQCTPNSASESTMPFVGGVGATSPQPRNSGKSVTASTRSHRPVRSPWNPLRCTPISLMIVRRPLADSRIQLACKRRSASRSVSKSSVVIPIALISWFNYGRILRG